MDAFQVLLHLKDEVKIGNKPRMHDYLKQNKKSRAIEDVSTIQYELQLIFISNIRMERNWEFVTRLSVPDLLLWVFQKLQIFLEFRTHLPGFHFTGEQKCFSGHTAHLTLGSKETLQLQKDGVIFSCPVTVLLSPVYYQTPVLFWEEHDLIKCFSLPIGMLYNLECFSAHRCCKEWLLWGTVAFLTTFLTSRINRVLIYLFFPPFVCTILVLQFPSAVQFEWVCSQCCCRFLFLWPNWNLMSYSSVVAHESNVSTCWDAFCSPQLYREVVCVTVAFVISNRSGHYSLTSSINCCSLDVLSLLHHSV